MAFATGGCNGPAWMPGVKAVATIRWRREIPSPNGSVQVSLPIWGHAPFRTRHRLVERMMSRRSQGRTFEKLLGCVVEEPFLAWFVTVNYRMSGFGYVVAGVLGWRRVAAADAAALGAAAKVEPPTAGGEAVDTPRAARRYRRIDEAVLNRHQSSPFQTYRRRDLDRLAMMPWDRPGGYGCRSTL